MKFGGMNMQAMMRQAQKLQEQMARAQEELEAAELTGTAGSGLVSVTLSGKKKMLKVALKPQIVDPDDIEMLEDLVIAAINEALNQVTKLREEKLPL